MQASIVIPVWNGDAVISTCLSALYNNSGAALLEVICVDNASDDQSGQIIATSYPLVRLLRQPVNLGFAGGVNVGLQAAQGDLFILLNQDCVVQPGWLAELVQAFANNPQLGIAGCTILNSDGTVNHAGACLQRPTAYSKHLTAISGSEPQATEYVTGAAFAIRREAWRVIGEFDEAFYPAYYEESDYCFRARRKGFEVVYVPEAKVKHLFSSREWQVDPVKHTANQHRARYRFISKHFDSHEVGDFFQGECVDIDNEAYFEQAIGRVIAVRDTLRTLTHIMASRQRDLDEWLSPGLQRQLEVGFTQILRRAFSVAEKLSLLRGVEPPSDLDETWFAATQRLKVLQEQEHDLLRRIYFRAPAAGGAESGWKKVFRLLILRPLSFLIGRDYLLLSELNTIHVARFDQMTRMQRLIERRLTLLEKLIEYDYR